MEQTKREDGTETAAGAAEGVLTNDSGTGNIVAIDQGRERREKRAAKAAKPDKSDRRAQRRSTRSATHATGGNDALGGGSADANSDVEIIPPADPAIAENMAEVVEKTGTEVPVELVAEAVASPEPVEARPSAIAVAPSGSLVAPLIDTGANPKTIERSRVQFNAAEGAITNNSDVIAVIAPLIRHVNGVTEQLNDAQINLGRVMAERDALRQRLAQVEGVEVSELSIVPFSDASLAQSDRQSNRLQRLESRADDAERAKPAGKLGIRNPLKVDSSATREEMARVARRRQLLAIAIFGAIGIMLFISRRQGNDLSNISRDSLADLQFVGIFFNMFFMVWMLYRVVRVGGKGAKWLFPQNQSQGRNRH